MSGPAYRERLYQVHTEFETLCFVYFAAPYSQSHDTTLPVGMALTVYEDPERPDADELEASSVHAEDWAPFIVEAQHRFDRNFRGSYGYYIKRSAIKRCCIPLDKVPDILPLPVQRHRALQGCLFGTAVGDAIGLPYEGLSPVRIQRLKALPLRHRFFFGGGMISDDTEHTCLVAQALIASEGDNQRFSQALAWKLRWWFLGLPAGIGMATLKACIKLWLGFPPHYSGVFSAGNGPGMRSAILGAFTPDNTDYRKQLVTSNTLITHRDPRALKGALIIAELAARNTVGNSLNTENCLEVFETIIDDDEDLRPRLQQAIDSARRGQDALAFCQHTGLHKGVSGYIYHTLPVVLQIVLRHNDNYEAAISESVACGGDTDTVAAIVGGIVGANVGVQGIPRAWLDDVKDWPRDKTFIHLLGEELAMMAILKQPGRNQTIDIIRVWIRNFPFMLWVLAHGFRRLLPPY